MDGDRLLRIHAHVARDIANHKREDRTRRLPLARFVALAQANAWYRAHQGMVGWDADGAATALAFSDAYLTAFGS